MKIDQNPLAKYPNEGMAQWDPIVESVKDKSPRRVKPYAADYTANTSTKRQTRRPRTTTDLSDIVITDV